MTGDSDRASAHPATSGPPESANDRAKEGRWHRYRGPARRRTVAEYVDDGAVFWNDCDSAILGVCDGRVVYGRERLVGVFRAQGMTHEEADEWVSFNLEGAYVGPLTPLIIREVKELWEP